MLTCKITLPDSPHPHPVIISKKIPHFFSLDRMNSIFLRLIHTFFSFLAADFCRKNLAFARKIMALSESGGAAAPWLVRLYVGGRMSGYEYLMSRKQVRRQCAIGDVERRTLTRWQSKSTSRFIRWALRCRISMGNHWGRRWQTRSHTTGISCLWYYRQQRVATRGIQHRIIVLDYCDGRRQSEQNLLYSTSIAYRRIYITTRIRSM